MKNVRYLLSIYCFIDALILMRSGFEYFNNAVVIIDNEDFFEDYKKIMSQDKNGKNIKEKSQKKYRDKLYLELDKILYFFDKDTRNYITKFLEKYYSALSKFAHGYINACVLSMIDDAKIIEFFSLFYMLGCYFIKGLLILCLDFYNNSKLDLNFVFSYLYTIFTIFERANCFCNKYSIDLSNFLVYR